MLYYSCNLNGRPFPTACRGNPALIQPVCDLAQRRDTLRSNSLNHWYQIGGEPLRLFAAH